MVSFAFLIVQPDVCSETGSIWPGQLASFRYCYATCKLLTFLLPGCWIRDLASSMTTFPFEKAAPPITLGAVRALASKGGERRSASIEIRAWVGSFLIWPLLASQGNFCAIVWRNDTISSLFSLFAVAVLSFASRAEMDVPEAASRFGLMLEAYLRGSVNHMAELRKQVRSRERERKRERERE